MTATPICDFARRYAESRPVRLHMPGHKGMGPLGCEAFDLTEIDGADDLQAPTGIIAQSEAIAGALFGARTFYSAEGSSLGVRAMLFLAASAAGGERPLVLAGRNAHKTFLTAAILLDFEIQWLYPAPGEPYHSCTVTAEAVRNALRGAPRRPCAVYLTSPDYLGHMADIPAIAAVCRAARVPLLVDNAHGAYLHFLNPPRHPMDLGADLCCDSAHKTLNALTGGAYLHVAKGDAYGFAGRAREALALFGSTSPSWLILQSLDACNPALERLPEVLRALTPKLEALRDALRARGLDAHLYEPMKLTLCASSGGMTGDALAARLMEKGIVCEFHDPDFVVLMFTPHNTDGDIQAVLNALDGGLPRGMPAPAPSAYHAPKIAMTPREAFFAPRETLPMDQCEGRVMAGIAASCPPCVPIVMCGEIIDTAALRSLRRYGVTSCAVVKNKGGETERTQK